MTLVSFLCFLAPAAKFIPLATLAVVLLVLTFNMSVWREIGSIGQLDLVEKASWGITLTLTVVAGLALAVQVALALAAVLYVRRYLPGNSPSQLAAGDIRYCRPVTPEGDQVLPFVTILRPAKRRASGGRNTIPPLADDLPKFAPIVILCLDDSNGLTLGNLDSLYAYLRGLGRIVILAGVSRENSKLSINEEFVAQIGEGNVLPHISAAIHRAQEIHERFFGFAEKLASELEEAPM